MASSATPAHLNASELGTQAYWDHIYEREIENHAADPDDEGTVWFSDSGAEEKMLEYIETLTPPSSGGDDGAPTEDDIKESTGVRVLDVGSGNGHMLFAMQDEGWKAQLVGVDYSRASINLALQIQRSRTPPGQQQQQLQYYHYGGGDVNFQVWDVLRGGEPGLWRGSGFDIVLDKGTFDAISLSNEAVDESGRRGCEAYASKIIPLIKPGGFLIITSCNWTEEELRRWFDDPELQHHDTIKFPSFTFGGQNGSTVSCLCFKRIPKASER